MADAELTETLRRIAETLEAATALLYLAGTWAVEDTLLPDEPRGEDRRAQLAAVAAGSKLTNLGSRLG